MLLSTVVILSSFFRLARAQSRSKNWNPKFASGGVFVGFLDRKNSKPKYGKRLLAKRLEAKSAEFRSAPLTLHALATEVTKFDPKFKSRPKDDILVSIPIESTAENSCPVPRLLLPMLTRLLRNGDFIDNIPCKSSQLSPPISAYRILQ